MLDVVERVARLSFAFVALNAAAVKGLFALSLGRRVWR
jgi:hypothetical protein